MTIDERGRGLASNQFVTHFQRFVYLTYISFGRLLQFLGPEYPQGTIHLRIFKTWGVLRVYCLSVCFRFLNLKRHLTEINIRFALLLLLLFDLQSTIDNSENSLLWQPTGSLLLLIWEHISWALSICYYNKLILTAKLIAKNCPIGIKNLRQNSMQHAVPWRQHAIILPSPPLPSILAGFVWLGCVVAWLTALQMRNRSKQIMCNASLAA